VLLAFLIILAGLEIGVSGIFLGLAGGSGTATILVSEMCESPAMIGRTCECLNVLEILLLVSPFFLIRSIYKDFYSAITKLRKVVSERLTIEQIEKFTAEDDAEYDTILATAALETHTRLIRSLSQRRGADNVIPSMERLSLAIAAAEKDSRGSVVPRRKTVAGRILGGLAGTAPTEPDPIILRAVSSAEVI
jgi:hypothetical protein